MTEPRYTRPAKGKVKKELSQLAKAVQTVQALELGDDADYGLSEQQERDIATITTVDLTPASTLAAGAYTGLVPAEALYVLHAKAKNAAILLATKAQLIYADALDNPKKYSLTQIRQCEKLMDAAQLKWPEAPPQSDEERLERMTQADVGAMSDDKLREKLMSQLRKG